jgi:hypothetical protein
VIDPVRDRVRSCADEQGRELLDVADGALPDPEIPASPRFLPPFDNAILSHSDRARIIAPEDRRRVSGDRLMRTFLVDGFVAGTWQLDAARLSVRPFRKLSVANRGAVEEEAMRLLAFVAPEASVPDVHIQVAGV